MRRVALFTFAVALLAVIVRITRGEEQLVPAPARETPTESKLPDAPESSPAIEHVTSDTRPLPSVLIDPAIRIDKARRALTVYSDGTAVKTYRVALGSEPIGDKEREGDNRTPTGEYYVCTKNADSSFHRALAISYPNAKDADRGLRTGLISARDHLHVLDALQHYRQPPWKTGLGGEIMIHGGGTASDWTHGCIAMDDAEAEELFDAIPLGTPVTIYP